MADDPYRRDLLAVIGGEYPPVNERNAHGAEVVRRGEVEIDPRPGFSRSGRLSLDLDVGVETVAVLVERKRAGERRRADGGIAPQPIEEAVLEGSFLRQVGVLGPVERHFGGERVLRVEAGAHRLQLDEAAQHEARPDEQREGDRHLGDDEQRPQLEMRSPRRACDVFEPGHEIEARRQSGQRAENDPCRDGDAESEEQDARIEGYLACSGSEARGEIDEQIEAEVSHG